MGALRLAFLLKPPPSFFASPLKFLLPTPGIFATPSFLLFLILLLSSLSDLRAQNVEQAVRSQVNQLGKLCRAALVLVGCSLKLPLGFEDIPLRNGV